MSRADRVRLEHMVDAAHAALSFVAGRSMGDLATDRMLLMSIERAIEIIGEAASKVSEEFRTSYSYIPRVDIVGMRHRLIHAYFDINREILWRTVVSDLPGLLAQLESVLASEER